MSAPGTNELGPSITLAMSTSEECSPLLGVGNKRLRDFAKHANSSNDLRSLHASASGAPPSSYAHSHSQSSASERTNSDMTSALDKSYFEKDRAHIFWQLV